MPPPKISSALSKSLLQALGKFLDVDIAEIERISVILQFNLTSRIDWLITFPVVF